MKKSYLLFILVLSAFLIFSCSHSDDEEELTDTGLNGPSQGGDSGDTLPEAVGNDEEQTDTVPASDDDKTDTMSEYDESEDIDISDNDPSEEDPDDSEPADDPDDSDPLENDPDDPGDVDSSDIDTSENDSDPTDQTDDSGDSQPDDDGDTSAPGQPSFPECSPASAKPCIDTATGLIWSSATSQNKKWAEAGSHCNGLTEGGFEDWRMPTISELRTLVRNCQKTATGGACNVTDECTASYSTANPKCYDINLCTSTTNALGIERCGDKTDGSYSLLGDASVYLWSSSVPDEDHDKAWYIYFKNTNILNQKKTLTGMVRCVRKIK